MCDIWEKWGRHIWGKGRVWVCTSRLEELCLRAVLDTALRYRRKKMRWCV